MLIMCTAHDFSWVVFTSEITNNTNQYFIQTRVTREARKLIQNMNVGYKKLILHGKIYIKIH